MENSVLKKLVGLKKWTLILIISVLCIHITVAIRIKFGQSADYSKSNAIRGLALKAGIEAAFKEANDNNYVDGIEFELVPLDDEYSATKAKENAITLTSDPDVFGIVGFHATATAKAALPVINAANFPMVGTATGAQFLRKPFQRNIINYKAGYGDETALMVEYLINVKKLRRIAILMQNDSLGEAGRDGVLLGLKSNNLYVHSIGYYDRTSSNITDGLNTILAVPEPPEAIIMVSTMTPTTNFMIAAKKIWPDIYYLCMSNMQPGELSNSLLLASNNDTTLLKNFIATQVVPLPTDNSIQVAREFQAALYDSDPTRTPDFNSFEGYMGARMVIITMSRMDIRNISRENFIKTAYDSGSFNFEGLRCGPLIDSDDPDNTPCNQCMRKVFFVTPNDEFEMSYLPDQPYRTFTTCGYEPYTWPIIQFGQTCDMTSVNSLCPEYVTGMLAAIKEINDAGGIRGVKLGVVTLDDNGERAKVMDNIRNLTTNPDIFGLVGIQDTVTLLSALSLYQVSIPVFGPLSGDRQLRKPFQKNIINFRVSLDDEVGSLVANLYLLHKVTKFAVLFEESEFGESGKLAVINGLSSKRLSIYAEGSYSASLNGSDKTIQNISTDLIDGVPEAIFLFGMYEAVASFISQAEVEWPSTYFLVTSLTHQEKLAAALQNSLTMTSISNRIIMSQTVPHYADPSILVHGKFKASMSSFDVRSPLTFTSLEGYLMTQFLIRTIGAQINRNADGKEFVNSVYNGGIMNIVDIKCGPFEATSLSKCNQALRNVWLNTITANGTIIALDIMIYQTCGFIPDENLDFHLNTVRLGFVIVAGLGIFMTCGLLMMLFFQRDKAWAKPNLVSIVLSSIGCILGYSYIFTTSPIPTPLLCTASEWILHIAFAMAYGPMFVKTWRISRIFNNKSLRKVKITDKDMMQQIGAILAAFIVGLLVVTINDTYYTGEEWTTTKVRYELCTRNNEIISYMLFLFHLVMLLWGSLLCYRVQGINGRWAHLNESKKIAMCIYNTSFLEVIAAIFNIEVASPNHLYILNSMIVIVCTSTVLGVTYFASVKAAVLGRPVSETYNSKVSTTGSKAEATESYVEGAISENTSITETATERAASMQSKNLCKKPKSNIVFADISEDKTLPSNEN